MKPSRIGRESRDFRRSQELADPEHHLAAVGPALRAAPGLHLAGDIGGRLPGERRAGRAEPFASLPMAARAGRYCPLRIAAHEQSRRFAGRSSRALAGERRIICRNQEPVGCPKPARDPPHPGMLPAAIGIGFELAHEIACIQSSQPWRTGAIALPLQPMAGEACALRPRLASAQCDHFAVAAEALDRRCIDGRAAGQENTGRKDEAHPIGSHRERGTCAPGARFPVARDHLPLCVVVAAALALVAAACKPPPEESRFMPVADAARGKQAIERVGCGSCHTIDGIGWPQGRAAPRLGGFAQRGLIAGRVPNRPDLLAAFVRNAPMVAPGTTMPAMPLSEQESRDVAAYLYELGN